MAFAGTGELPLRISADHGAMSVRLSRVLARFELEILPGSIVGCSNGSRRDADARPEQHLSANVLLGSAIPLPGHAPVREFEQAQSFIVRHVTCREALHAMQ